MKTILYLLGIGVVVLAASNWKHCTTGGGLIVDANGNLLTDASCVQRVRGNFQARQIEALRNAETGGQVQ
jgi:hypothetical protein